MRLIKVLTIVSKLDMGGVEKTLLSCIPYLQSQGIQISVLCSLGGCLDDDFRKLGVELIDFDGNNKPFKDAFFLKKLLKNKPFDLVHSRSGHTSGLYSKICKQLNIPIIVSIHNEKPMFRNTWTKNRFLKALRTIYLKYHKNLTIANASRIVGHSRTNLNYYLGKGDLTANGLYQVIFNGVDFSKFTDYEKLTNEKKEKLDSFRENKEKVLVHIGSFKEQKNHRFLIEMFFKLDPVKNNFGLILIGDGGLRSSIEARIRELAIEDNVLFTGIETNIAPYLYGSDIFVFPSLYEGFGNVLIEAQYARLPLLVSDIGPHYESSLPAYNKYMFNATDIDEGKENFYELLKDIKSGNIQNDIENAFIFANRFSISSMSNNLGQLYKELASGK